MLNKIIRSPMLVRVAPFILFVALTACQGLLGEASRYWVYAVKTVVGAWMLWVVWPHIPEMRWKLSWPAAATGIAVFLVWVGTYHLYPKFGQPKPWNPFAQFGANSFLAWMFIVIRLAGVTFVVPPLEEVFYRSFLYRYIAKPDFEKVPLGAFLPVPFLVTCAVFGFAHYEWLAGILCAAAYQGLVCWKKRLGDAMTAHAITNLLLGIYVVTQGDWKFW